MKGLLVTILLGYVLSFTVIYVMRHKIIYPLDPTTARINGDRLPGVRQVQLDAGGRLAVWVADPKPGKPVIVYFHGNAGNLENRTERFNRFLRRGYGLVAMSYRGSSGSAGEPSEAMISGDAMVLRGQLDRLVPAAKSAPIVYYGESLGSAVAVKLAAQVPPNAMVLEAPFLSVPQLASEALWFFPVKLVLDEVWATETFITAYDGPLLIVHGTEDQVVPFRHGQAVFDLSPSADKRMFTVEGGGHENLWSFVDTQAAIFGFVDRL